MKRDHLFCSLLAWLLVASSLVAASALSRKYRQSEAGEQEATTAASPSSAGSESTTAKPAPPTRLYPDLARAPNFVPPFGSAQPYPNFARHGPPPALSPFGMQMTSGRLNAAEQQPAPYGRAPPLPRQLTPAERLQSESFANGLGRRLLGIIGVDTSGNSTAAANGGPQDADPKQQPKLGGPMDEAMRALQNSTVLQQLGRGVNSIYGGLSKVYNSTVHEQLQLLQERLKSETQNSTNPWHQRMAEQVPGFFKQVAARVGEAQQQLNKVWQDIAQANSSSQPLATSRSGQQSFFDQFGTGAPGAQGDFFNQIGRSLGFGNPPQAPQMQVAAGAQQPAADPSRDLAAQVTNFWHTQVQPQIGAVRQQVARAWRDLTASGAFSPETVVRARNMYNQNSARNNESSSSSDLVNDILKEVEMSGSEYTLIGSESAPKQGDGGNAPDQEGKPAQQQNQESGIKLSPQMQNRLIAMQREVNQLWMGLTNSLQSAINNVRDTVNPPPVRFGQFGPSTLDAAAATNNAATSDPALNGIDGKVKDLSKLQRDADMVYDTVQQQQRQAQQMQTFGDKFKNFFNNMNVDLSGVNQLPDRIGQSFNRFGVAVGDLWNQIPERWDNLLQNMRPQQQLRPNEDASSRMKSTTTTTEDAKPERA